MDVSSCAKFDIVFNVSIFVLFFLSCWDVLRCVCFV